MIQKTDGRVVLILVLMEDGLRALGGVALRENQKKS